MVYTILKRQMQDHNKERISIIVPVLNEAETLGPTLSALRISEDEELIVVDGGSSDETPDIAGRFTDKVFTGQRGRARQMNLGAEEATGSILMFLHADCKPPEGGFHMMRVVLDDNSVSAGAFDLGIDHPAFGFRIIESGANLRSHVTRVPYGDQGLFMRRSTFEKIGGFRDMPLMEDIEIAGRLKREGKIKFLRPPIITAPRRWLEEGLVYTTLRDWTIALAYSVLGVSPEKLMKHYRDVR
jgi:rSAM/selenodomain-associated transferase 2